MQTAPVKPWTCAWNARCRMRSGACGGRSRSCARWCASVPRWGLMGTLIPMAYALQGLAEGNLPSLASNLVTAFAATVIGLAVSVVAYLVAGVRESWVRADIQALAFRAEELLRGPSADAKG